jgi:hypothetical protein
VGAALTPAICTSASPPVTSSGNDDRTSMLTACAKTGPPVSEPAMTAAAIASGMTFLIVKFSLSTTRALVRERVQNGRQPESAIGLSA